MAQINVDRKSSSAVWWILAIAGVALVLWLLFGWNWGAETPAYGQGIRGLPQQSGPVASAATILDIG